MVFQASLAMRSTLPLERGAKLAKKLEFVRRIIEEKFLATGEVLSQAIEGIEHLIASLDKLVETLDAGTVEATTQDLKNAAAKLFALPANHAARLAHIVHLCTYREALTEHISEMRCILAYMRAFTLNIKNAAKGIDGVGDEFSHIAQDISQCIEKGGDELKQLEADLLSLQHDLEADLAQGEILEFQIDFLLPMVPEDLITNAKILSDHYHRIVETAWNVANLARDIHKRVNRALTALQIGDITSQRIDHILAGVIMLDTNGIVHSHEQSRLITTSVYALLAAQLSATAGDFQREVSEISRSMAGLAADARELLRLHDLAYGCVDSKESAGFLGNLENQIHRTLDLVVDVEKADDAAIGTGRITAVAAQALSKRIATIQSLKNDVQAMALNTASKCNQIGEAGRSLSVIANGLCEYAGHLETAAAEGLTTADLLTESADALIGCENTEPQSESENENLSASKALGIAGQRIREARDRTETDIAAIVAKGDAVLDMLDLSATRLNFQSDVGAILDLVTTELEALGEGAVPDLESIAEPVQSLLREMSSRYTMAQEREVHWNFVEAWGIGNGDLVKPQRPTDDLESILF